MDNQSNPVAPVSDPVLIAFQKACQARLDANGKTNWLQADSVFVLEALAEFAFQQGASGEHENLTASAVMLRYCFNQLSNPSAFRQYLEKKGRIKTTGEKGRRSSGPDLSALLA